MDGRMHLAVAIGIATVVTSLSSCGTSMEKDAIVVQDESASLTSLGAAEELTEEEDKKDPKLPEVSAEESENLEGHEQEYKGENFTFVMESGWKMDEYSYDAVNGEFHYVFYPPNEKEISTAFFQIDYNKYQTMDDIKAMYEKDAQQNSYGQEVTENAAAAAVMAEQIKEEQEVMFLGTGTDKLEDTLNPPPVFSEVSIGSGQYPAIRVEYIFYSPVEELAKKQYSIYYYLQGKNGVLALYLEGLEDDPRLAQMAGFLNTVTFDETVIEGEKE